MIQFKNTNEISGQFQLENFISVHLYRSTSFRAEACIWKGKSRHFCIGRHFQWNWMGSRSISGAKHETNIKKIAWRCNQFNPKCNVLWNHWKYLPFLPSVGFWFAEHTDSGKSRTSNEMVFQIFPGKMWVDERSYLLLCFIWTFNIFYLFSFFNSFWYEFYLSLQTVEWKMYFND